MSKTEKTTLKTVLIAVGLSLLAGVVAYFGVGRTEKQNLQSSLTINPDLDAFPIVKPNTKFGFALDTFHVEEGFIKPGMYFGDILQKHQIGYPAIQTIVDNSKDVFDVSKLRAGKDYMILSKDSTSAASYFIYEPSDYEYIVFDLQNELKAKVIERPVETRTDAAAGVIETSLWNAMMEQDLSYELAALMEDALQWSVSFYQIQPGDKFKVVYDEDYIDGKSVAIKKVHAAYFENEGNEYYAIYFPSEDVNKEGFYDLEGRPLNRGFLRAPLKTFRISSAYNLRRFHPVLKRVKPHFGTDYAAPYGTPIYAVGNGVIDRIGRTRGNGNFIRIKHDETYKSQYLHMQKFAKGMRKGKQVRQGQVIGYVGSTGLATGPHVCFRFWKNGKQVDHRRLKFPPANRLPQEDMGAFNAVKSIYEPKLEALTFEVAVEEEAQEVSE